MELKYCEDLVDIVEAANTAGWLEAEGKIVLESDEDLTKFLVEHHKKWAENKDCGKCFAEYILEKLVEKYGAN